MVEGYKRDDYIVIMIFWRANIFKLYPVDMAGFGNKAYPQPGGEWDVCKDALG